MERIASGNQLATLPAPEADVGAPGYFGNASDLASTEGTIVTRSWLNRIQEEIVAPIQAAGIALSGTANNQLLAAINALIAAAAIFSKKFTSAPQAISGTTIAVAHGLGAQPFGWSVALVCVTANAGFNPGDQVLLPGTTYTGAGGGTASYMGVWANATDVGLDVNSLSTISAGGGTSQYITPADWEVVLRAWL